jgi:hypothetical protein
MPQEFTIGIIIHNKKKFLLLRHLPGHWGFIKEQQYPTETKENTVHRIALEHLSLKGLFITKDFTTKENYFFMKDGKIIHKEVEYLLAETQESNITFSSKFTDAKWLSFEEALPLVTFKETKHPLIEANNYLKDH